VLISVIHEVVEKLAGLEESQNCLSDMLNELSDGDKCIKCVHHKKNKSLFRKKTIIGIQW
jgi:hypothetical protein